MAKTKQIIENPIIGDKFKILISSKDSNGELMKMDVWTKVGANGPPEHYHPIQSETFEVFNGKLGMREEGKEMILTAGQKYTIKPNTRHTFWNAGDEELYMNVELRPALKTEFFLETIASICISGKAKKDAMPKSLLQFAAIMHEYDGETYVTNPPLPVQKFMAKVIGGFAKLLGYKGFVPFPENYKPIK